MNEIFKMAIMTAVEEGEETFKDHATKVILGAGGVTAVTVASYLVGNANKEEKSDKAYSKGVKDGYNYNSAERYEQERKNLNLKKENSDLKKRHERNKEIIFNF